MSQNLTLEVVTPSKIILETTADYVTIPGELGELGILPSHIPLLTNLQSGVLCYKSNNVEKKIAVHYGYAEVCQDRITILANSAELAEKIDVAAAKAEQENAESELAQVLKDPEKTALANELQRQIKIAITRQNAAK